jgi:PLD-like domain
MFTQAYFENIKGVILKELSEAQTSINIAVAWFTDNDLYEMLLRRKDEHLIVELILTKDEINFNSGIDFDKLSSKGGSIFWADPEFGSLMHNKFCVIDGTTVLSGSYNWTNKAQYNYESITLIKESPELANEFINEFRKISNKIIGKNQSGVTDLNDVFLRLEAIKSLLLVKEIGIAKDQLKKLKMIGSEDNSLATWLFTLQSLLDKGFIHESVSNIDEFIAKQRVLAVYIDQEIIALRLEMYTLNIQVQAMEMTKSELEKIIHLFQIEYNKRLGKLILRILDLQAKINENDDEKQKKAKEDYDEFNNAYKKIRVEKVFNLTIEEEIELRKCYKQASKLCHPDLVNEKQKKDAANVFISLKKAYDKNDLKTVKEILKDLESGIFQERSKSIVEKQELISEVRRLRLLRKQIEEEINEIKKSDSYVTINSLGDWKKYFSQKKKELEIYLQSLEGIQ